MPKGIKKDGTKLGFKKGHKYNVGKQSPNKGKTLEEICGVEKAKQLKKKKSLRMKGNIPQNILDRSLYSKERNNKMSLSRKGKTWEEIYGINQAKELKKKMSIRLKGKPQSYQQKFKKRLSQLKENGSNWQGGKVSKNRAIRDDFRYKEWREKVFKRDNYTCQECGKRGGYLEAHHIKKLSKFPDIAYDINNGITYCLKCHIKNDEKRKRFIKKT